MTQILISELIAKGLLLTMQITQQKSETASLLSVYDEWKICMLLILKQSKVKVTLKVMIDSNYL
jgi:hypothetical protein